MVRHWQGYNFAKCSNFSSSSRVHSVFFIEGSNHSYHLALHCLADFLLSKEATLAHWFLPYFMTAAFRISSSVFFHTPPLIMMRIFVDDAGARGRPVQPRWLGARRRGAAGGATSAWGGGAVVRARPARLEHLLRCCSAAARRAADESAGFAGLAEAARASARALLIPEALTRRQSKSSSFC